MSLCTKTEDGAHQWVKIGSCFHTVPSARAGHDYHCYECTACGRVGHSRPRSFACGMRRQTPEQWQAILAKEQAACPIWERLQTQTQTQARETKEAQP